MSLIHTQQSPNCSSSPHPQTQLSLLIPASLSRLIHNNTTIAPAKQKYACFKYACIFVPKPYLCINMTQLGMHNKDNWPSRFSFSDTKSCWCHWWQNWRSKFEQLGTDTRKSEKESKTAFSFFQTSSIDASAQWECWLECSKDVGRDVACFESLKSSLKLSFWANCGEKWLDFLVFGRSKIPCPFLRTPTPIPPPLCHAMGFPNKGQNNGQNFGGFHCGFSLDYNVTNAQNFPLCI